MSKQLPKGGNKPPYNKILKVARNILFIISLVSIVNDFKEWENFQKQISVYLESYGILYTIFNAINWVLEHYTYWVSIVFWMIPPGIAKLVSILLIITGPTIAKFVSKRHLSFDKTRVQRRTLLTLWILNIMILLRKIYFDISDSTTAEFFYVQIVVLLLYGVFSNYTVINLNIGTKSRKGYIIINSIVIISCLLIIFFANFVISYLNSTGINLPLLILQNGLIILSYIILVVKEKYGLK